MRKLTIASLAALAAVLTATPVLANGRHHGGYGYGGSWGHHGWRPLGGRPGWHGYSSQGPFYRGGTYFYRGYSGRYVEPYRGGWGGTILPPADWALPQPPVVVEQPPVVQQPPVVVTPPAVVTTPPPVIVQPAPTVVINQWAAIIQDYQIKGYSPYAFRNSYGNTWNVWISTRTKNTLIFPNLEGYRGDPYAFNCLPPVTPSNWPQCTRYNIYTGQVASPAYGVGVIIHPNGLVDDHNN